MVVTRIPPSPTGKLHIGTARTALFNFLFTRKHGGKLIYRSEDTDKERSKREYEEENKENLNWLGITWDAFYRQSEQSARYSELLKKLVSEEKAYISKEPAKDDPSREVGVVRLKNPGVSMTFTDIVRGDITFDTTELGDFVIARSIDDALYHFAVVVDDIDGGVTHIIRGEDHISNTPRQILIQEALGAQRPQYAHIPLILAPDRSKMSKRKGTASINEYREKGYLPEAINNYLALLGWNPGTDQEIFSLQELIDTFTLEKIQKSGAIFDSNKLNWFNAEYVKKLPEEKRTSLIESQLAPSMSSKSQWGSVRIERAAHTLSERMGDPQELRRLSEAGELDYYFDTPTYEKTLLVPKKEGTPEETTHHLQEILKLLNEVDENSFSQERVKESVWEYASKEGKGAVLWPMRVALSGEERSPDPFTLAEIFGKEETLARIKRAVIILAT